MIDKPKLPGRWSSAYNAANIQVCECYGQISRIKAAQQRLMQSRRAPLWLLKNLDQSLDRLERIILPHLIRARNELWSNPPEDKYR